MNFRKTSFSLLVFLFGVFLSPIIVSAITINSLPLTPINVSFSSYKDNILKGTVWKTEGDISNGTRLFLSLSDVNKAVIFKKELKINTIGHKYWEKPFELNLFDIPLNGYYTLQARILNNSSDTVAFGQNSKKFITKNLAEQISEISDLQIKSDLDLISGSVKFKNNKADGNYFAEINIFKEDIANTKIKKLNSESVFVKKGETVKIPFSFSPPSEPQLYTAQISISNDKMPVTGDLERDFLVSGDFGEFYEVEILPKKYIKKGDTITLNLRGGATVVPPDLLNAKVKLTDNKGFSVEKSINVTQGKNMNEFTGKDVFLATKDINQLFASVILLKDSNELAKTETKTDFFKNENKEDTKIATKIKTISTKNNLSIKDKSLIILILVLIILAIIIFIRGLARSNQGKKFFIFLGLLFIGGTTFAAFPTGTLYPTDEMSYNSNLSSGEFNTIGLWGYLSSIQGGLLPVTSETIKYDITLTNDNNDSFVGKGEFINENSFEYKIDLPLNIATFPSGIPVDGNYSVSIRLFGTAIAQRLSDLSISGTDITINLLKPDSSLLHIIIDSTAPNPSFVFKDGINTLANGDFVNDTFSITPKCGDSGSGCYKNYSASNIRGNFCDPTIDERTFCNDKHEFKICDNTGNCTTKSADIDFFDPIKPKTDGGQFSIREGVPANNNATFAAFPESIFLLDGTIDPGTTTNNTTVNNYVCENNPDFYLNGNICEETVVECALSSTVRGISTNGAACAPSCPTHFTYDSGTGYCEPECYYDKFPYCFDLVIE